MDSLSNVDRCLLSKRPPPWAGPAAVLLFCALCAASLPAAENYNITQLAEESMVNREPVISNTGLIAWFGHAEGLPDDGGGTDVFVYFNGETKSITRGVMDPFNANIRPRVTGNSVVWQTTRPRGDTPLRQITWVLQEVPDDKRDFPYKELPAWYANKNRFAEQGVQGDFNLDPRGQVYEGPFTNVTQYSAAYSKKTTGTGGTNVFGVVEQDPSQANPAELQELNISTNSVPNELMRSRRKTITFNEICRWDEGKAIEWLTHDTRNDLGPSVDGSLMAWQKAKAFPFGWEIMALDGTNRFQLTTNYYYDMAPEVHERKVTWYGWDGNDYEIFVWDADTRSTTQVTSNRYDDVSPRIWKGEITWEGYPSPDAHVYHYKDGVIKQLSNNIDNDVNPRVWDGKVVWQGFDGDDFEIYYFDGSRSTKLTNNIYDDVNPHIRDGTVTWMGYKGNWDAEIFVFDGERTVQLTENEVEDKDPQTADGKVVWQTDDENKTQIYLAVPE